VAPRILDEGLDVPAIDLVVVTAGTRQQRQKIQCMGRVRRKDGGRGAVFIVLYAVGTAEDSMLDGHETFRGRSSSTRITWRSGK